MTCMCMARRKFYVVLELAAIIGVDMLQFGTFIVIVPFFRAVREYALKHHHHRSKKQQQPKQHRTYEEVHDEGRFHGERERTSEKKHI